MGKLAELQTGFQQGMRQDIDRDKMIGGALWNAVDMIPDLGGYPLAKRGGWARSSPDLNGVASGGSAYIYGLAYATFSGGAKLIAFTNTSRAITIASSVSATDIGTSRIPVQTVMHADKLIIPHNSGAASPYYYDGTTLAALAGSPPNGKYVCLYKDRTVLGYTTAQPSRVYFSAAANPAGTWDTTNAWISVSLPVTGLAALPGAILVFMADRTARIRGSIPPSGVNTGGDMIVDDPIFNVGCSDARSIATLGGTCVFANTNGIYLSNGSNLPEDLTAAIGLKRYWGSLFPAYDPATWVISGGMFRNRYIVSVVKTVTTTPVLVDTLMIDLDRRAATRISNVRASAFARGVNVQEELYFATADTNYVNALSGIFAPAAGNKNDGDSAAVLPTWDHPVYAGKAGRKRWRAVFADIDMRDAASDNPTLTVAASRMEDASSVVPAVYSAYVSGTIPETTARLMKRVPVGFQSQGMTVKFTQTAASSITVLHGLHADVHPLEPTRRT